MEQVTQQQIEEQKERAEREQGLLAEMQKQFDEQKVKPLRWKPVDGETFFWVDSDGDVGFREWSSGTTDEYTYKKGNLFKDMEEAEAHNSYLIENADRHHCERLLMEAIAQANKENNNWKPDWSTVHQTKHCFRFNMESNVVWTHEAYSVANFPMGFYFNKESVPRIKSILGPQADRIIRCAITGEDKI